MKQKVEYMLIWVGTIVSFIIVYLTKVNATPAAHQWVYELGQYLWFNLAISFLGSVIFYYIVVYLPDQRRQKQFVFQMGMELVDVNSLGLNFFYNLKNAAGASHIHDTSKMTVADIEGMLKIVTPQTVHKFENEIGQPKQTFESYLAKHGEEMEKAINKALTIPTLLYLQRLGIITGNYSDTSRQQFEKLTVYQYYILLKKLGCRYTDHYSSLIDKQIKIISKKVK
jgi:hypothetical protein